MVTASPQSYLRSDDGREYRDNYGYYRYIQGVKLYVECHDRYYDARKDDCGSGAFRSRTGDDYDAKYVGIHFISLINFYVTKDCLTPELSSLEPEYLFFVSIEQIGFEFYKLAESEVLLFQRSEHNHLDIS